MSYGNNNQNQERGELVEIGALWWNRDQTSMNGAFGSNARLLVLPNKYKQADNHPDFKIFVTREQRPRQGQGQSQGQVQGQGRGRGGPPARWSPPPQDDRGTAPAPAQGQRGGWTEEDIPF